MAMFKDQKQELERLQSALLEVEEELSEEEFQEDDDSEDWEETEDWEASDEDNWEEDDSEDWREDAPEDMDATRVYPNFSNSYKRIYNNDTADTDLEDYSQQIYSGRKRRSNLGLCVIALCLSAAILGVLAWWIIRFR